MAAISPGSSMRLVVLFGEHTKTTRVSERTAASTSAADSEKGGPMSMTRAPPAPPPPPGMARQGGPEGPPLAPGRREGAPDPRPRLAGPAGRQHLPGRHAERARHGLDEGRGVRRRIAVQVVPPGDGAERLARPRRGAERRLVGRELDDALHWDAVARADHAGGGPGHVGADVADAGVGVTHEHAVIHGKPPRTRFMALTDYSLTG